MSRVAAKQHFFNFHETRNFNEIMNPAKFREDKIVDFREIPNKNFVKILMEKISQDLFYISVVFS